MCHGITLHMVTPVQRCTCEARYEERSKMKEDFYQSLFAQKLIFLNFTFPQNAWFSPPPRTPRRKEKRWGSTGGESGRSESRASEEKALTFSCQLAVVRLFAGYYLLHQLVVAAVAHCLDNVMHLQTKIKNCGKEHSQSFHAVSLKAAVDLYNIYNIVVTLKLQPLCKLDPFFGTVQLVHLPINYLYLGWCERWNNCSQSTLKGGRLLHRELWN